MISRLFRVLGAEAAPLRPAIAGIVVGAVLRGVGFVFLVPILEGLFEGDTGRAWRWTAALAVLTAVYSYVHYRSQLAGYRAAIGLSRGLFARLGDHISTLPLGWFSGSQVGHVGQLTSKGVIDAMGVPAHLLRPLLSAIVTPVTVVVLMFAFDWQLALVAAASMPIAAVAYRWAGSLVQRSEDRSHRAGADAANRIVEFAQNQAVLRAFGRHAEGNELLDRALVESRNAGRALMITSVPGIIAFTVVVQLAFTALIVVGANRMLDGGLGAAELIALLVLAVRFAEPLALAADLGAAIKVARQAIGRMDELLATPTLVEGTRSDLSPDGAQNAHMPDSQAPVSASLENVSFSYDGSSPTLTDVSISVPAGSMIALVGPSGSGKTTVTRLLARFWDVDGGVVRVAGLDVRELSTEALMSQLAMVFQETYLFDGTIAENLRLARSDASDADLDRVARLARLDEVVERLPGGWDARVGEGGTSLSGGERQRVSIARALLKPAPIVLLDEATAALDAENEAAVQNAISSLRHERTVVVIAHGLQTVVAADRIFVLDEGRVVEEGSHDELLGLDGRYAAFWRERSRAAGWRLAGPA